MRRSGVLLIWMHRCTTIFLGFERHTLAIFFGASALRRSGACADVHNFARSAPMLASLITQLIEFVRLHPEAAYALTFLLALSESLPLIGAVIPGTAIILALSALVPGGALLLWPLLGAATAGAIAGDGFAFWLGHRYREHILTIWPLSRYPAAIRHSREFFDRHGAKSVFFARFLPGVRAFVPMLAGALGMQIGRFYAVNIVSAVVWAPAHILPGVLFGAALHSLGAAAKPLAAMLVALSLAVWLIVLTVRYTAARLLPLLARLTERLQAKCAGQQDRFSRLVVKLLEPESNEARLILCLGVVVVLAAWLFFGILKDVFNGDPLVQADLAIYHLLQGLRSYPGDMLMVAVTELGDTFMVVSVTVAVVLYLLWSRARHAIIFFLGSVLGASLINTAVKVALHRSRPIDGLYQGWSNFSFPSGHSTVNMALYGAIAIIILRNTKGRLAIIAPVMASLAIFGIAFSRLYLGAHWFSDVMGGMAFGTGWIAMLAALYLRQRDEGVRAGRIAAIPIVVLATIGAWHVASRHNLDMQRYVTASTVPELPLATWLVEPPTALGSHRIDLTGETEEPFVLEFAGDLGTLRRALISAGWADAPSWNAQSALALLNGTSDASSVAPLPALATGRFAAATLTRATSAPDHRLVLRLWSEDLTVIDKGMSAQVYKATVTRERLYRPLGWMTLPREEGDASLEGQPLLNAALTSIGAKVVTGRTGLRAHLPAQ